MDDLIINIFGVDSQLSRGFIFGIVHVSIMLLGYYSGFSINRLLKIVSNLIVYADKYYESAVDGLRFVPIRSRFSILYALRLYQAIGHNILKHGNKYFEKKINTSQTDKLLILIKSFIEFIVMFLPRFKNHKHQKNLHDPLHGLPYVDEKI